jgi:hypothetical protein
MIVLSFKEAKGPLPKAPYFDFVSFSLQTIHRVTFKLAGLASTRSGTSYWRFVEDTRNIMINGNHFGER